MRAMVLEQIGQPLISRDLPMPVLTPDSVLIRVRACAVCRTDLHVVVGELPNPKLPLIPGHEIVGIVEAVGGNVSSFRPGDRVGVPWLGFTCGKCDFCQRAEENLCVAAKFTGYQIDGGYAEFTLADHRYCFPIPESFDDAHAAPLLCAGLIGYRSLRMTGDARNLGIYGFGAAAHLVAQVVTYQKRKLYGFTRKGDGAAQQFARELGAVWVGGSDDHPPEPLDAAIIFAPAGELVPLALAAVRPGGIVVCGGIHMSDIPQFPYSLLWGERTLRSVANLTRRDGDEFLKLAREVPVRTVVRTYPLEAANQALNDLRTGKLQGAAVLIPQSAVDAM